METKKTPPSFTDLEAYQLAYRAMLDVFQYILPTLPPEEKYDLGDKLRVATKEVPRLIAEAYSKRRQKAVSKNCLEGAINTAHDIIVSLNQLVDLYAFLIDTATCRALIEKYDAVTKQCYQMSLEINTKAKPKTIDTAAL